MQYIQTGIQAGKTNNCYLYILKKVSTEKSNTFLFMCKNMTDAKRQYNNFMQYIDEQREVLVKATKQTKNELIVTFKNGSTLVFSDNDRKCLGVY